MTMQRIILLMVVLNTATAMGCVALTYTMLNPLRSCLPAQSSVDVGEGNGEYNFFQIQKVIVSLQGEGREHYFVLDLVLQVDAEVKNLEQIDPVVRNSVVTYLSTLSFTQLRAMSIVELQTVLEKVLQDDFSSKKLAMPIAHVLVSKLIVQ
jgi:flagellar FliL protein